MILQLSRCNKSQNDMTQTKSGANGGFLHSDEVIESGLLDCCTNFSSARYKQLSKLH